jgi:hypothetical protein
MAGSEPMGDAAKESAEDAALHERFRFLRERVFAVSRAFVDRVLGGVEDSLAKPAESFATPFFVEMVNLASSILGETSSAEPAEGSVDKKREE